MARRMLSTADGVRLRANMFLFIRKQKADSQGWIHDLCQLVMEEFKLTGPQASYHLDVLVKEGRLVRKERGSSLYRVANGGKGGGRPSSEQKAAGVPERGPSKGGQDAARQILVNFAGQPGFQSWLKAEIAKTEKYLAELRKFRR